MNTKDRILALLEKSKGQIVSGQDIADKLKISRNAVWKAISTLRQEGYQIDSATKLGYSLRADNDILSFAGMLPFLTVDCNIQVHQKVEGSTNTIAKEIAIADNNHTPKDNRTPKYNQTPADGVATHGTVIIANEQTAGRGRYGRPFFSPSGHGIYMSLVIDPTKVGYDDPTLITIYTAVAVCEAIEHLCKKSPGIKWVNDLFLDGKKICGISAEAVMELENRNLQWIVVGIGINFTLPKLPTELVPVVGAIFDKQPHGIARNRLAAEVLNRMFNPVYSQTELIERYKKRLFILGKKIKVEGTTTPYEATAIDLDESGRLLVQNENNELLTLNAGEISVRF